VFAERDPVGPDQSANLYAYLDQDPANLFDPMGKQFGPYGGFNSLRENQELWRKYQAGETSRTIENFLADALHTTAAFQQGNLLPTVDFTARHMFGVEPTDTRQSWGIVRRLAAGIPYEGFVVGDNVQFFDRGEAGVVGAIYTFDTTQHWQDKEWRENPVYGPMAFQGVDASLGVGMDYAVT